MPDMTRYSTILYILYRDHKYARKGVDTVTTVPLYFTAMVAQEDDREVTV